MNKGLKIRFAVMINGYKLRKWQHNSIDKILNGCNAELVAWISNPGGEEDEKKSGFFNKICKKNALYTFLLNRLFKVSEDELINISTDTQLLKCKVTKKGLFSEYFNEDDLQKIKELNCDFILRFGYGIIRGEILDIPKYGIWSYHHGNEQKFRGGPPAYWEIRNREHSTGSILQKLNEKLDAGQVLLRRSFQTQFHSFKEMRGRLLGENTDMPLLAIRKYILNGEKLPDAEQTNAKVCKLPSSLAVFFFLWRLFINRIFFHYHRLFRYEKWGIIKSKITDIQDISKDNLINYLWNGKSIFPKDENHFYADVFAVGKELIFENFSYKEGYACISKMDENGSISILLDQKRHLSYPFVFQDDSKIWIIPEDAGSGQLSAYKYENEKLSDPMILIDKPLIDASILKYEERYYIFAGISGDLPNEKLHVFYANKFEGPYFDHLLNPVVVNPEASRSGGNILKIKNEWVRPAQVSLRYYGEYLQFNRILKLSPEEFEEEKFFDLKPSDISSKYCGLHNISLENNALVIDVKKHRIGFRAMKFKIKQNR